MRSGLVALSILAATAAHAATPEAFGGISSADGLGQAAASCVAALQSGNLDLPNLQNRGWQTVDKSASPRASTLFRGSDHSIRVTTTSMFGQICIVEGHSQAVDQPAVVEATVRQIENETGEKVTEYDGTKGPQAGVLRRTFFTPKTQIVLSFWPDTSVMITTKPL